MKRTKLNSDRKIIEIFKKSPHRQEYIYADTVIKKKYFDGFVCGEFGCKPIYEIEISEDNPLN